MSMNDDPRHPRIKDFPWEVPQGITPDAFLLLGDAEGQNGTMTFLGRYWLPVSGGIVPFLGSILSNAVKSRPRFAGIQYTIAAGVIGAMVGEWMFQTKAAWCAERDLQYFHYICLHPEDFKAPKRVKYRDFLEPWIPIR